MIRESAICARFAFAIARAFRYIFTARMAPSSKQPLTGADVLKFLRMFEGAAATFAEENGHWSLWLPEFHADEHPLTPASQVFFPVILRHDEHAFAIRFFYDCSTGKVRYYTSAIPEEIARLPEFENAVSELFRHTLPVEAIRQRSLSRRQREAVSEPSRKPRFASRVSLADPAEPVSAQPAPSVRETPTLPVTKVVAAPAPKAVPRSTPPTLLVPVSPRSEAPAVRLEESHPQPASPPLGTHHQVRLEIGPRARSVLLAFVVTIGLLGLAALGAYAYLSANEDPGVLHHRLQIEEMRLRAGK